MRREWIEIACSSESERQQLSPSMRREWIEILYIIIIYYSHICLPPCGGSGLKFGNDLRILAAWIVSLHAEGVD